MTYIDGYLIPIATDKLDAYKAFSEKIASVYREYGAIRIVDCLLDPGDDDGKQFHADEARDALADAGPLRDFIAAADAGPGETVILSWTEWPSKAARDAGLKKALSDPRVQPKPDEEMLFEGRRLVAGGFTRLMMFQEHRAG
ncbi:MAG: DUF1428 domain-containing protein [Shinella sp.]|uniref:DUF1428 domain-containing protein n=1 Tax=Shinella sp. TaxID=1870904 RepID=UPI003C71FDBB